MRLVHVTLTVGLAACLLGRSMAATGPVRPAPTAALQLSDGTVVSPTDYKGKVLLVDFWASWCIPCRTSFPALDQLYQTYQTRGLEVLAINVDEDRKLADAFLAAHPYHMPIVFDPKGEAPRAFGVSGMPSSFIVDRTGNIRFTHMGYSAKVLDAYRTEINQLLSE